MTLLCFGTRCPLERESAPRSHEEEPVLKDIGGRHFVACHLVERGAAAPRLIEPSAELQAGA